MTARQKPLAYAPTGELYLGSRIRALRQAKGWTLTELGQRLGCQLSLLSTIETNRVAPPPQLLERIATLLDVPLPELAQAPLPPGLTPKRPRRTATRSQPSHPAPAVEENTSAVVRHPPPPRPAGSDAPPRWTFGDQVEAVIASFRLTPPEAQFAQDLILELTRSLCLRLADERLPSQGPARQPTGT